jgi:hypothetical protein
LKNAVFYHLIDTPVTIIYYADILWTLFQAADPGLFDHSSSNIHHYLRGKNVTRKDETLSNGKDNPTNKPETLTNSQQLPTNVQ